mgnify:CR=1 FL=1
MKPFAPRQLPVPHAEVSSAQVGIRQRQNGRYIRHRHGSCVQELADKTREASVSITRRRDRKVARDVTHAAATAAADSGSPAARCAHGVFLQRAAKDFSSREHAWITPSALQCLSNARTTFLPVEGGLSRWPKIHESCVAQSEQAIWRLERQLNRGRSLRFRVEGREEYGGSCESR